MVLQARVSAGLLAAGLLYTAAASASSGRYGWYSGCTRLGPHGWLVSTPWAAQGRTVGSTWPFPSQSSTTKSSRRAGRRVSSGPLESARERRGASILRHFRTGL